MKVYRLTWKQIYNRIHIIREKYYSKKFYGIPRGGSIIAGLIGNAVDTIEEAEFLIDDIVDSGSTFRKYLSQHPDKPFIVAFNKDEFKGYDWIEFPWEVKETEETFDQQINKLANTFGELRETVYKDILKITNKYKNEDR